MAASSPTAETSVIPPRSVYIHVPFCRQRCGYCNFTLVSGRDDLVSTFLDCLEIELRAQLGGSSTAGRHTVDTIFLGGGTPSYLAPNDLSRLLTMIERFFSIEPDGEYACEMNPRDCTPERLGILREAGVNRISLGGQSFSERKLKVLERDHSGDELQASIELCASYVGNVSLDLIFAAPGESLHEWQQDVERALCTPIRHLSAYGLTIERGSAYFARRQSGVIEEVDQDLQLLMYEYVIDTFCGQGWEHYEVSSFAIPGYRCRHNEAYWLGQPWLALGPGAASFQVNYDGSAVRRVNHRSTTTYIRWIQRKRSAVAEQDLLSREDCLREQLVFGLRRLDGVDLNQLSHWWGSPVRALFEPHLEHYLEQGWLSLSAGRLKLTRAGLVISDSLWPDLLCNPQSHASR